MEQIALRPLCPADLDAFFALTGDEAVARHMRFNRTADKPAAEKLLFEILQAPAFAIEVEGVFSGVFSLKPMEEGAYSISTFLAPAHWGKGYSTQILRDRIAYAKTCLGASALFAYVVGNNFGSRRVLEKLDFSLEEILEYDDLPSGLYIYKKQLGKARPAKAERT